jgi:hypothetical protein
MKLRALRGMRKMKLIALGENGERHKIEPKIGEISSQIKKNFILNFISTVESMEW